LIAAAAVEPIERVGRQAGAFFVSGTERAGVD